MYKKYVYEFKKDVYDYVVKLSNDTYKLLCIVVYIKGNNCLKMGLVSDKGTDRPFDNVIPILVPVKSVYGQILDYSILENVNDEESYNKVLQKAFDEIKKFYFEMVLKNT